MINKTIAMTITQIEKSSEEFKKTHKIKVSGPYDDEEMPKWFKNYAMKTDARLKRLEEETPKWFKEWVETDYKPFKEFVMKQFEDHGWIKK